MAPRVLHRLNATRVKQAKRPGKYEDGGGLRLLVTDTSRRWVMRVSIEGKRKEFGLGPYPTVSLEVARARAAAIRNGAQEGRNVVAEDKARRGQRRSFKVVFEAFFGIKEPQLASAKHANLWRRTLETYAFPYIGDRAIADIDAGEIIEILKPIWHTKPETAQRVLQRLEAVFKSAIVRGWRTTASPTIGVRQELGVRHKLVEHHRALPHTELPAFITKLRERHSSSRLALEFLILTAARSGEVRLATWEEIIDSEWVIPAERMKSRRVHVVPLSDRSLEVLKEARRLSHQSGLIFPGSRQDASLSDMTLTKLLRDTGLAEVATVHGFRSSFKGWCAEAAKVRVEVSEAALAHVIPNKVKAAYLRGTFLEERRAVMQMWADYLNMPPE